MRPTRWTRGLVPAVLALALAGLEGGCVTRTETRTRSLGTWNEHVQREEPAFLITGSTELKAAGSVTITGAVSRQALCTKVRRERVETVEVTEHRLTPLISVPLAIGAIVTGIYALEAFEDDDALRGAVAAGAAVGGFSLAYFAGFEGYESEGERQRRIVDQEAGRPSPCGSAPAADLPVVLVSDGGVEHASGTTDASGRIVLPVSTSGLGIATGFELRVDGKPAQAPLVLSIFETFRPTQLAFDATYADDTLRIDLERVTLRRHPVVELRITNLTERFVVVSTLSASFGTVVLSAEVSRKVPPRASATIRIEGLLQDELRHRREHMGTDPAASGREVVVMDAPHREQLDEILAPELTRFSAAKRLIHFSVGAEYRVGEARSSLFRRDVKPFSALIR